MISFCLAVISIPHFVRCGRLSFPLTSAGVATGYGLMWKAVGFHGKYHGLWHFHAKGHRWGNGTCRGRVRDKHRRTNHGNPRMSARITVVVSAQTFVATSTSICGHCHSKAAIMTEVRVNCHGSFRQRPTASTCPEICGGHGHCHGNPPIVIHIV